MRQEKIPEAHIRRFLYTDSREERKLLLQGTTTSRFDTGPASAVTPLRMELAITGEQSHEELQPNHSVLAATCFGLTTKAQVRSFFEL